MFDNLNGRFGGHVWEVCSLILIGFRLFLGRLLEVLKYR